MIRLFVGLALPDSLRERLAGLSSGVPQARWTPPQNFHITLRFIGEVSEPDAETIHEALSDITGSGFDVTLSGCGAFETGNRAHTLWVGVERSAPLLHLHEKVEHAMLRAELKPEGRKYTPHVTLARIRGAPVAKVQNFIAGNNLLRESFRAESFTLFSSQLGHGHPVYTAEMEYGLG